MTEIEKLKQMLAEIKARVDSYEKGESADFDIVIVDGVEYYDTKETYTHQDALDLAAKHGLRVLERWELCKLYDESSGFRESLAPKRYWSASVFSVNRNNAWQFLGPNGDVSSNSRNYPSGTRCVVKND